MAAADIIELGAGQRRFQATDTVAREGVRAMSAARAAAFSVARAHSARIRVLKLVLPCIAALAVVSYFVSTNFGFSSGNLTATIAGMQFRSDQLTMLKPQMNGHTNNGSTYDVGAARAIQNIATPDVIRLEEITARLNQADGSWAHMEAATGTFHVKQESLNLTGGIKILRGDGTEAVLEEAHVDMKTQRVTSSRPVRVEMLNGDVRGATMVLDADARTITLEGGVIVNIRKRPTPQK